MARTAPAYPDNREPLYTLARLLARQAVAEHLAQESAKKQQDSGENTRQTDARSCKAL